MSRTRIAILLIFVVLLIWFYVGGQRVQDIETAFAGGLFLGLLFGWWSGGLRVLRKQRKLGHHKVDSDFEKNKELL